MAINPTKKLVWLVRTIRQAGKIPFREIQRKWADCEELSGGKPLPRKTFENWIFAVWDTFGLAIECEKGGDYPYYIANEQDLHNGSIENWLLSTYAVSNSLEASKKIKDRILLEDVPSGFNYLDQIIDAIATCHLIHISYRRYGEAKPREHYLMPLCVKLFHQRWYFVGRVWTSGATRTYCLDRILEFRLSSHTFEYPDDFKPNQYFSNCYGIITDTEIPVEKVIIKSTPLQAHYLRDLPFIDNQVEAERTPEYSIFHLTIRPTYDFIQQILWNGDTIEVLKPIRLRNEIKRIAKSLLARYK